MTQIESENEYVFIRTSANFCIQTQFQNPITKINLFINFTYAITVVLIFHSNTVF